MTLEQNNFRKWADVQPDAALQTGAAVSVWRVGVELFGNRLQQARGRGGGGWEVGGGRRILLSKSVLNRESVASRPRSALSSVLGLFGPRPSPTPKDNLSLASDARPA